jgi:hypothetical protein
VLSRGYRQKTGKLINGPIGWAKSKVFYLRLLRRDELTDIQEAFLIYVEFRKEQLKMMELQIVAASGMTKENSKIVIELLNSYESTVLPVEKKAKERSFEDQAREQLAKEVKKAFVVKQTTEINSDKIKKNKNAATLASHYLLEKDKEVLSKNRVYSKSSSTSIKERR